MERKSIVKWIIWLIVLGVLIAGSDLSPTVIIWMAIIGIVVAAVAWFALFVAKTFFKIAHL